MNDIKLWAIFTKVRSAMKKIQQLSYVIAKTEDRYPSLESMTPEELNELIRIYLALGLDIETAYEDWKEAKKEYDDTK